MAKRRKASQSLVPAPTGPDTDRLLGDLRSLIDAARDQVARAVNAGLVLLYWGIGERIRREILGEQRAAYGERIVQTVSAQLTVEYGRGYTAKAIWRMIQFVETFSDREIVAALSRQLGWSHFMELIPLSDPLKRDFYAEMCRLERWSVRTLRDKIRLMFYERTAVARKPAEVARQELDALREEDRLTPDLVFRDPYVLDFLRLQPPFSEEDLELGILHELERFLLELGGDFAFMARQKRITVDYKDYYLDLLFYHRRLRRLVAVELKLDHFQAADKGQMELYLRWLEEHERQPGEEAPLGLILCAGKSAEHVELLRLEESGIRVAEYLTELPPRALLEKKLEEAIRLARHRLAAASDSEP
jgi:predicted nuclease of restriction endonuclease-like (RecB) superfamily